MNLRAQDRRPLRGTRNGHLRLESLESRLMLSAVPPTVAEVNVSSTDWSSDFVDYLETNNLGTGGYAVPEGADQLHPLPWNNINQIKVTFSEDVDVQASDMSLSGVNETAYEFSDFSYDAQSFTATWTLSNLIDTDNLLIDLSGAGLDPVVDANGNVLDGEWITSSSTFNSGDATAGGDFEFRFDVLPGDANQTGLITYSDMFRVYYAVGSTTQDAAYEGFRDIDGSGDVIMDEFYWVFGRVNDALPTGDPVGVTNDAPTTQGLAGVEVDEDAADHVISLFDAFDDEEDSDSQMTYQVVSNSNEALFASTAIDGVLGNLTLDFADDAFGEANVVVRATDSSGLFVETTVHVLVNPVNGAPLISNYWGEEGPGNIWVFSGEVTDEDHDPTGWTVDFYGVLDGYTATVEADGTFELVVELEPNTWGSSWVQTQDDAGLLSNQASFYVGST